MFRFYKYFSKNPARSLVPSNTQWLSTKSKKLDENLKKKLLFYIENELPDKNLEIQLKDLKNSIKSQVFE